MQARGNMSKEDYANAMAVHNRIVDSAGKISDQDLAFLIQLIHKPTQWPGISNFTVLSVLDMVKETTPSQKKTILAEVEPLTTFPEGPHDIGNTRRMAAAVLGQMKDRQVIPYLLPLLKDKYPYVRSEATKALKKLGYEDV
jgi:hypothetical protein